MDDQPEPQNNNQPQNGNEPPVSTPQPVQPNQTPTPESTPPVTPPQTSQPNPAMPQSSPEAKNNKMPKWVKILIGLFIGFLVAIIAFILIIFVFVNNATQEAVNTSDQVVNAIQEGDAEAIYNLASDEFKEVTNQDQLETIVSGVSPLLQGEETIIGKKIQDGTDEAKLAIVLYKVPTDDGDKYIKVITTENSNGWQVINFRTSDTELELDLN